MRLKDIVEEVHREVQKQYPDIDLSIIYKVLDIHEKMLSRLISLNGAFIVEGIISFVPRVSRMGIFTLPPGERLGYLEKIHLKTSRLASPSAYMKLIKNHKKALYWFTAQKQES